MNSLDMHCCIGQIVDCTLPRILKLGWWHHHKPLWFSCVNLLFVSRHTNLLLICLYGHYHRLQRWKIVDRDIELLRLYMRKRSLFVSINCHLICALCGWNLLQQPIDYALFPKTIYIYFEFWFTVVQSYSCAPTRFNGYLCKTTWYCKIGN